MNFLEEHRLEIFKKYSDEELIKDVDSYKNSTGRLSKVLNHFFKECIFDCKSNRYNFTPNELLSNDELLNDVFDYIKTKPSFYTGNDVQNIEKYLWNGTKYARRVSNFDPKQARDIYFKYFPNALIERGRERLNILDTSSGFGSRMSAVLLNGHNYFGFDPNKELHDKLMECAKWYNKNGFIDKEQKCRLYCKGSEIFLEQLENTIDVSFTSPPYFNLEQYSKDKSASTTNYNDYNKWLNEFVKPTIENTYRYLKVDGYAMINIKNLTRGHNEKLFDDWYNIFNDNDGFEFVEIFDMSLNCKRSFTQNCNYNIEDYHGAKEPVMCFRKVH